MGTAYDRDRGAESQCQRLCPPYRRSRIRYLGDATGREDRLPDQLGSVVERHRAAEEIALRLLDPDGAQRLELGRGLDALCHDKAVSVARERNERGSERPAGRIEMDMPRERHVELDDVGTQLQDVL